MIYSAFTVLQYARIIQHYTNDKQIFKEGNTTLINDVLNVSGVIFLISMIV